MVYVDVINKKIIQSCTMPPSLLHIPHYSYRDTIHSGSNKTTGVRIRKRILPRHTKKVEY